MLFEIFCLLDVSERSEQRTLQQEGQKIEEKNKVRGYLTLRLNFGKSHWH